MFSLRAPGPLRKAEVYEVTFRVDKLPSRGRIGPERMSHPAMLRQCYRWERPEPIREITLPVQELTGGEHVPMRRIPAGAILSIALAAASCGGSSTEPDDDTLTGEETLALVEIAMGQGFVLVGDVSGSETVTPEGVVLQVTAPCAMGGTVAVDARASFIGEPGAESAESASVGLSVTLVHSGCTRKARGDGDRLHLGRCTRAGDEHRAVNLDRVHAGDQRHRGRDGSLGQRRTVAAGHARWISG